MKIKTIKGNPREQYWSSWNSAGEDSYQVVSDNGAVLKRCDTYAEAEKYIRDNADWNVPRDRLRGW